MALTDAGDEKPSPALPLRLVVAVLLAGVLAAPLAVAWAVTRATVHETVGITPTTFAFTTTGHSELRLGVAGSVSIPVSRGPLGVVASVDGPGDPAAGDGDVASYVTPQMLELYTGLFHDPGPAVQGYLDLLAREFRRQLLLSEVTLAGLGGLALFALSLLSGRPLPLRRWPPRTVASAVVVLASSLAVSVIVVWPTETGAQPGGRAYALSALDGTVVAGSATNSPVLRLLLGGAVPKAQALVRRQERQQADYRAAATQDLTHQEGRMTGPRPGESAVLLQSDMHCNTTMIHLQAKVAALLRERYGPDALSLLAITGDLTTNGTAAEGICIEDEAAIAGDAPVAAVTGNHESDISAGQMAHAGMTVLDGADRNVGGFSLLGDGDPARSELFGATQLRGKETEAEMGSRLYGVARAGQPDLVLVHEGYAAASFLGVDDMTTFLRDRGSPSTEHTDDVRDLPASAVFYGHWHRSIEPRVVWNSDGTWTLVMELDTSGGAIDSPTFGHFSTPWSSPQQEASFPVVFLDRRTKLVTGYQVYRFDTDGTATVQPRVEAGGEVPRSARAISPG
ncbi:MAG: metallophosphoesterase [Nocardioidaceae bacterium]